MVSLLYFQKMFIKLFLEIMVIQCFILLLLIFWCCSFFFESERGLFPNTEFVYDLELPVDFIPENADGEVETFELLPAQQCLEKILSDEFKTTSAPITLDFLIRHGFVTPENGMLYKDYFNLWCLKSMFLEHDFLKIIELLHVPLQTLYSKFPNICSANIYITNDIKENGTPVNRRI